MVRYWQKHYKTVIFSIYRLFHCQWIRHIFLADAGRCAPPPDFHPALQVYVWHGTALTTRNGQTKTKVAQLFTTRYLKDVMKTLLCPLLYCTCLIGFHLYEDVKEFHTTDVKERRREKNRLLVKMLCILKGEGGILGKGKNNNKNWIPNNIL